MDSPVQLSTEGQVYSWARTVHIYQVELQRQLRCLVEALIDPMPVENETSVDSLVKGYCYV